MVLTTIAGGPFGDRQRGAGVHRHRAARRAHLLADAAAQGHRHARSARGVPRQLLAGRRDAADSRAGCASSGSAHRRPQPADVQHRRRQSRDRLRDSRPGARARWPPTPKRCASSRESMGIIDADTTLKLNKPELRAQHRSRARRRPRRPHAGCRGGAAADGRRRPGSDALPRSAGRRGLRRPAAAVEDDRRDPDTISRLYVSRANGEMVRLDSVVSLEEAQQPVARRSPGSPAPGQRARRHRARLCARRSTRGAARAPRPSSACRPATPPRSAAAAASSSARSASSAGRSCCRSPSCTWCWRRSTRACSTRSSSCCRCRCRCPSRCSRST